jgi:molybdopterin converting factor small subunit
MKLTIKLLPPYSKRGEPGEHTLQLKGESIDLQQLAWYLSREWKDKFDYPLIDAKKLLTAEFMVNGKHATLDTVLKDEDMVTIIPYICGG